MTTMLILFLFFMLLNFLLLLINFYTTKMFLNDREKSSPFECGFDPLTSSRLPFSMQFYMISIIFLIFDIEIIIFLPMIKAFLINFNFWMETSLLFLFILIMGLYIEWFDGALTWLK